MDALHFPPSPSRDREKIDALHFPSSPSRDREKLDALHFPLPRGEREGPDAKRWEGEGDGPTRIES